MNESNFFWRLLGVSRIINNQKKILSDLAIIDRFQKEIYYAELYNNTTKDSQWLINKSISPTGAAFNYASLYFLYRALDKMRPQNILEFGLGQSSKLIYQYVDYYKNASAITYEHDEKWVNFFLNEIGSKYDINVYFSELEEITYKQQPTLSYKNNCEELKSSKFDMILVDGPFGSKHYSRPQLINLVTDCLMPTFCIMLHDSERNGEKETITEITNILKENKVKYCTKEISPTGYQDLFVWCSNDLEFLLTI